MKLEKEYYFNKKKLVSLLVFTIEANFVQDRP